MRLLPLAALMALAACQSTPSTDTDRADFVFVFIKSGPARGLSAEEVQRVSVGHFANMNRLADEGHLLVAGPLGEPRVDPKHRGIFVFDTADVTEAEDLAASDPGAEAGVFVFEMHPWRADASLRRLNDLDRKLQEVGTPIGETIRPYVLVRCDDAAAARSALAPLAAEGHVVLFGELTAQQPAGALFALDVATVDAARQLLGDIANESWRFHPWWSSKCLVDLPAWRG